MGTRLTEAVADFAPQFHGAEVVPSPNFGERRDGRKVDALILHYTGMESGDGAQQWLCAAESEVSSHYLVHEDGRVVQMVPEEKRAWHAGRGSWCGEEDVNSFSIGIEIVNPGHFLGYPEFPEAQIEAVVDLCRSIVRRHSIPAERVLGHSDVAPGRKIDPGEKFPWEFLARRGVGHFVTPEPITSGPALRAGDRGAAVEQMQNKLARYGYAVPRNGVFDASTKVIVQEFQRHFRPERIDGVADFSTRNTLDRLLDDLGKV